MLKWVAVMGLLVMALFAVLGTTKVISHGEAAREQIQETVDKWSPDAHEAARIKVLLGTLDDQIGTYEIKLGDTEKQAGDLEADNQRVKDELEHKKGYLRQARTLLAQDRPQYEIHGKTYSRREVEQDAQARLETCRQLQRQSQFNGQAIEQLRATLQIGQENLHKAQGLRDQKLAKLKELQVRLDNAHLLYQVNDLAKELRSDPLGAQTELAKAFANYDRRVRELELKARGAGTALREGAIIPYEDQEGGGGKLVGAIDQFLKGPSSRPAEPDRRDSAEEKPPAARIE